MHEYLSIDAYKNSKQYRKIAKEMAEEFDLPIETINQIVGKRLEQLHPNFFEDFDYRR